MRARTTEFAGSAGRASEPRTFVQPETDRTLAVLKRAEIRLEDARRLGVGLDEAREIYAAVVATALLRNQAGA